MLSHLFHAAFILSISLLGCSYTTAGESNPEPNVHPNPDHNLQPMSAVRIRLPVVGRCLTVVPVEPPPTKHADPNVDGDEISVVTSACSTTNPFQRWDITPQADGGAVLTSKGASDSVGQPVCLTLADALSGSAPTVAPCDGSTFQNWTVTPSANAPGQYTIAMGTVYITAGGAGANVAMLPPGQALQGWILGP